MNELFTYVNLKVLGDANKIDVSKMFAEASNVVMPSNASGDSVDEVFKSQAIQ